MLAVVSAMVATGCQTDIQGASVTMKALYKGENGDKEFLSRGSGQTGGNAYSAGGGQTLFSWGSGGDNRK